MSEFKMSIRNALLSAANKIEANPSLFDFNSIYVPDGGCGSPGCAIGWVAHFRGGAAQHKIVSDKRHSHEYAWEPVAAVGTSSREFYDTMSDISEHTESDRYTWKDEAGACARCLRGYAVMNYPAKVAA
jgi:hypothetical protein